MILQLQVRYMCLLYLKLQKMFRHKIHKTTSTSFGKEKLNPINSTYNTNNTYVLGLIIFL